jgi:polyisoprenyl-phosphate glycosyltransferase
MTATSAGPRIVSLVVPALNEARNVPGLLARIAELRGAHTDYVFELVLIDDGSSDGTADALVSSAPAQLQVVVVQLARTFGSHQAISAGLRHCTGDCAIVLGADSQEPPELVAHFLEDWEQGSDVVWGIRRTRTRSWRSELPSKLFSYVFTRYADLANYPAEGPSGILLDRQVIDQLNLLGEHNRNVLALVAWLGYHQTRRPYDQLPREHGESSWTVRKMVKLAADSLLAFSSMPLRTASYAGILSALAGLAYAAFLMVRAAFGVQTPSGWPTLLVVVLLVGGLQLTMIGIIGEYVWRVADEVRQRPLYVVRKVSRVTPATAEKGRETA